MRRHEGGDVGILDAHRATRVQDFLILINVNKSLYQWDPVKSKTVLALAEKVVRQGDEARAAYLDFLRLGGSKFPLDELLDAGIDMRSPEPIERAVAHFEHLTDLLIEMQS